MRWTVLPLNRVLVGDALTTLRSLPSASVDCVVTSPPYWGLRNYQTDGQIGLEASVHGWVGSLVTVLDEVARVLRPTGVLWLNVADSYSRTAAHGAPPKGFVLGPERLLLALARRGWRLRSRVVWAKSNPMPTSVKDRLSCTWEPVYLLVRSHRYWFDLDAAREPATSHRRPVQRAATAMSRRAPDWAGPLANGDQSGLGRMHVEGRSAHPLGRNPGDVWRLPTAGFRGAHFATFPPSLVRRPILAGCPERVCGRCGQAWRRQLAKTVGHVAVLGAMAPGCHCDAPTRPGLVLDPFFGAGTTGLVAEQLGRDWLGIELNPTFAALATERIATARAGPVAA